MLMLATRLILDGLRRAPRESTRLFYLAFPPVDRTAPTPHVH